MADIRPAPLTQLSFETAKQEIIDRMNVALLANGFPPFDETHAANPWMIMVETLALYSEVTGATIDNRILSSMIITARNLEDATIAAESRGYEWQGTEAAVVTVELDFGIGGHGQDVVIADGHQWHGEPSFVQDGEATILAGTQFASVTVRQVTKRVHSVISNGQIFQLFTLPELPVVKQDSNQDLNVTIDILAVPYTPVDDLFELAPGEKGMAFRVDHLETGTIETGDGTNGETILLGDTININYETSLGNAGRIGQGVIVDTVDPILDVLSAPVSPTITQPVGSSGGQDRETLESMQFNAPRALRTLKASINREDFQTNAQEVDGVLRALVLTQKEDPSVASNVTLVLVAADPSGSGETVLFSDDHNDGVILLADWATISGVWTEAAGLMSGDVTTAHIKHNGQAFQLPCEFKTTIKAQDTTAIQLRLLKSSNNLDYIFIDMVSNGIGSPMNYRVGQILGGVTTEVTNIFGITNTIESLTDVTLRYTLEKGVEFIFDGTNFPFPGFNLFHPDASFREKLIPAYFGKIDVDQTDWVSLVDLPIPNTALLADVDAYMATARPTLVSHVIQTGQMSFYILSMDIDLTVLTGFTQPQVQTNVTNALIEYLSITRVDENGDFANDASVSISLDEIYNAIRQNATGVDRIEITYPTDFDVVPGFRELILLGEINWV